ncbi:4Fe-4S dicluster domain-containing protein [Deltaproteobacteria bacterium OttesenSCG-928-M10]|nr:4Fe-4S dicluster domain-containing protein [Deltaproteobacteria bacterium OttesenSCG-928-M10]
MAEVIKPWDAFELLAPPLAGAAALPGLKKGRPVSAGQLLARHSGPGRGQVLAPVGGFILEINEREIIIERDENAVGEPPKAIDLQQMTPDELRMALPELGLDIPLLDPAGPVIVNTLDAEAGYGFSAALFNEHRETMLAGLEAVGRLAPGVKVIWALKKADDRVGDDESFVVAGKAYPAGLPAVLKKTITGRFDPEARGVLDGRDLYGLGRAWRTGLPVSQMVLTLGAASYFVPVGSRAIDLLAFANMLPKPGEAVVAGGLARGRTLSRLEQGLGRRTAALHLKRGDGAGRPVRPCRLCGRCALACPAGLAIASVARLEPGQWLSHSFKAVYDGCILCGACALACPAERPLLSLARLNVSGEAR